MLWKRGWFLNTLKYRAEKDLHETIYQNEAFLHILAMMNTRTG
jgi:hypothetical protein